MKVLRGDFGRCIQCDKPFTEEDQRVTQKMGWQTLDDGSSQLVHMRCLIEGKCYACSGLVFAKDPRNSDTNEYGSPIVYHHDCTKAAKAKLFERGRALEEQRKRRSELDVDRARRQEREGRSAKAGSSDRHRPTWSRASTRTSSCSLNTRLKSAPDRELGRTARTWRPAAQTAASARYPMTTWRAR